MAETYLTSDEEKDVAVLIGLDTDDGEAEISIDELERLCDTAGIETAAKVLQRREKQEAATYIGKGKAEEIADAKFDSATYAQRHKEWLASKIDCAKFLTWFIENYPNSATEVKNATPDFWERFK